MWAYPGKKLLFMGQEFGQLAEWNFAAQLDWHLLNDPLHSGLLRCVSDLNRKYRENPALHVRDCESEGFHWIVAMTRPVGVRLVRWGFPNDPPVAADCNFTPQPRHGYRIGLPFPGRWRELMNTDASEYGGSGLGNLGAWRPPRLRRMACLPRPRCCYRHWPRCTRCRTGVTSGARSIITRHGGVR